jgi:hypothetical protein
MVRRTAGALSVRRRLALSIARGLEIVRRVVVSTGTVTPISPWWLSWYLLVCITFWAIFSSMGRR